MNFTDEPSDALETRLKKLRPSPVSPELLSRLRAVAPVTAARLKRGVRFPLVWAAAAAASAALVLVNLFEFTQPSLRPAALAVAAAPVVESSAAERTDESSKEFLVGTRAAGTWTAPDGQMYRVVQCLSMNLTVLRDPSRGEQKDVMEPRPRVLLLAMGLQ
jgi:hypothetical protein